MVDLGLGAWIKFEMSADVTWVSFVRGQARTIES